jgi:hypothetical protein
MGKTRVFWVVIAIMLMSMLMMGGYVIYQSSVVVAGADEEVSLLNQIVDLQRKNSILQSQNLILNSQTVQITQNLQSFATVEELQSFASSNLLSSNVGDSSDVCVEIMMIARQQGFWMGIMPKKVIDDQWSDKYVYTPRVYQGGRDSFIPNNYYDSYLRIVNIAVVGDGNLYTVESGMVVYAGSMSANF